MSSLTSFLKLVKPDRLEGYSVATQNKNLDDIDAFARSQPLTIIGGNAIETTPAGKRVQVFKGKITTSTGAGGENRTESLATNGNGIGGLWLGYQGIPAFGGIQYVSLSNGTATESFAGTIEPLDVSTTRIKFRGRRHDNSGWMNGYGSIIMYVEIVGWAP